MFWLDFWSPFWTDFLIFPLLFSGPPPFFFPGFPPSFFLGLSPFLSTPSGWTLKTGRNGRFRNQQQKRPREQENTQKYKRPVELAWHGGLG